MLDISQSSDRAARGGRPDAEGEEGRPGPP